MRPGEVSLAHHGVLFLDELTEFRRDAVEGLRQPLEDGRVVITRAVGSVEFPARFTLVAAANPCPCGFDGDGVRRCVCRPDRVQQYRNKLSGPLLDRIDIRLRIPRLTKDELLGSVAGEALRGGARPGRGGARPAASAMGRPGSDRATRTSRGRSRAGLFAGSRCGGAPHARGRDARAHGSRTSIARSRSGRTVADLAGSERHRHRSPGRGALLSERFRDPGARPCRVSRRLPRRAAGRRGSVPDVDERLALLTLTQLRGLRPLASARRGVGGGVRHRDASSRFVAGGWAAPAIARGCRGSTRSRPPRASTEVGARLVTPGGSRVRRPAPGPARIRRRVSSCAGSRSPTASERVAIVGSRKCSDLGRAVAQDLGARSWRQGWSSCPAPRTGSTRPRIEGALQAGGRTIAVLGSGIDIAYPASSRELLGLGSSSHGTLLSEYPPGYPAGPHHFPARNRIVVALASALVVVEGEARSGSRISVDHALDLGREVFAVPGPVTSPLAETPLEMIRDGATIDPRRREISSTTSGSTARRPPPAPPDLDDDERRVWDALAGRLLPGRRRPPGGDVRPGRRSPRSSGSSSADSSRAAADGTSGGIAPRPPAERRATDAVYRLLGAPATPGGWRRPHEEPCAPPFRLIHRGHPSGSVHARRTSPNRDRPARRIRGPSGPRTAPVAPYGGGLSG